MKNKFNITPLAALIALSLLFMGVGCEKTHHCSHYEQGRFYKLSEPYQHPYADYEIKAIFLSDGQLKGITGRIPAQFCVLDTFSVKVSLKEVYPKGKITNAAADNIPVCKIMCIENN